MNDQTPAPKSKAPWHLWLFGVLALVWSSVGAYDYVMTETRDASYMSAFTPEQLAYFYAFPMWIVASWALSVWGGVLGAVLLLLRSRLSVPVFGVSMAMILVTSLHNVVLTDGFEVMGGVGGLIFTAVIFIIAVALFIYARILTRIGTLR